MQPIKIYPEYAMILTYDVKQGVHERYYRWVTNNFLPALQSRKIYMQHAWHVVGVHQQPTRQVEFITEELDTIRRLLEDPEWETLETRLKQYTTNYNLRVTRYTGSVKI